MSLKQMLKSRNLQGSRAKIVSGKKKKQGKGYDERWVRIIPEISFNNEPTGFIWIQIWSETFLLDPDHDPDAGSFRSSMYLNQINPDKLNVRFLNKMQDLKD